MRQRAEHKASWYERQVKRHCIGQSHTLMHRSVFWLDDEFLQGIWGKHKCWDNATMQVRNKFIQSRSFTARLGWYYYGYYGDRWSYGLTYFSFWEGLLWPASALNCALFPECKGKPNMKEIERCSRKQWERKREQQTTHCGTTKVCHSVRGVNNFIFGNLLVHWKVQFTPKRFCFSS